ncbi:MAG: esterase-like activity of phytase family protein, partial [Methylophilus sp.]
MKTFLIVFVALITMLTSLAASAAKLVGWAEMPMHTYAEGVTSGQFNDGADIAKNKQIVQGFSAVLQVKQKNEFYFLVDNGFGEKNNSADALLRLYKVKINFSVKESKESSVEPLRFLNFSDPSHMLGFKIQADYQHYYQQDNNPQVDPIIIKNRLLTGADIDPESIQVDKNQHYWVGDEFGPFLLKLDSAGKVLRKEIPLNGVMSPDNPFLDHLQSNLPSSGGYEAMAINPARDRLYPMLENSIEGDPNKILRIYEFDINSEQYTGVYYQYQLDEQGTNATDLVAINDTEFLVLERNTATEAKDLALKKVFLIDIKGIKSGELVKKTELVDLMNLQDPDDLNSDNKQTYAFAYTHIEGLLVIDKNTIVVCNDNNYKGRSYFIKVGLDQPLNLESNSLPQMSEKDWHVNTAFLGGIDFGDHTFFGWMTVFAYFLASARAGYKLRLARLSNESGYFWIGLTVLLLFLGFNKQLDLQSNFTDMLRTMAKQHGWYEQRRTLQMAFIVLMGLSLPILFISVRMIMTNSWRRYKVVWSGVILLLVFIVIRASSFHHVDLFF